MNSSRNFTKNHSRSSSSQPNYQKNIYSNKNRFATSDRNGNSVKSNSKNPVSVPEDKSSEFDITRKHKNKSTNTASAGSQRLQIIETAKDYLGTPYQYGGSTPRAFDCSGFTQYCLRRHQVSIARSSRMQSMAGKKIKAKESKAGDLIFFGKRSKVDHVGIVTKNTGNNLYVIHASTSHGVIEQDVLNNSYWKPKILYARDIVTVQDNLSSK